MNINKHIQKWASLLKEEIDIDKEEWKTDMGRSDDRFYEQFIKEINRRHSDVLNKLDKASDGTKLSMISWLMFLLEKSFDTQVEFENSMKKVLDSKTERFKKTSLHKEILETISHYIGELHYQKVSDQIDKEIQ